jgi:hypothetical protein
MDRHRKLSLIASCTIVLIGMQGCRNEEDTLPKPEEVKDISAVERLMSKDGQEIAAARDELLASRKMLIAQLIDIVDDEEDRAHNKASVETAMYILGEMRALEAIDVLVDHLGFPFTENGGITVMHGGMMFQRLEDAGRMYPGVDALIKIGEPCLDAVLAKQKSPVRRATPYVAAMVVLRGRDWTRETLKTTMEEEPDVEKKKWLKRSLDVLTKVPD